MFCKVQNHYIRVMETTALQFVWPGQCLDFSYILKSAFLLLGKYISPPQTIVYFLKVEALQIKMVVGAIVYVARYMVICLLNTYLEEKSTLK